MKRGALLALVLATALVALRQGRLDRPGSYDRHTLPAYDAYAYVAMAERPSIFTVAPWGYRVLTPLAARALSPRDVVRGFRWLTLAGLALSGAALYAFLRRLGHQPLPALAGVAFLCLCGAAGEVIGYPFLVEPLALLLQVLFLLAVESGAGAGALALLSALAASNKELQLLMLPVVFTARVSRDGARTALLKTAASAAGALATIALLRWWWAPVASLPRLPAADAWRPILAALWTLRGEVLAGLLLSGLLPLALAGAVLPRSRTYLRRYGLVAAVMLAFPFAAFLNVGEARPPVLFGKNTDRLLLFAVPVLLPLALHAVGALLRSPHEDPPAPAPVSAWWDRAGWVVTALFLLALGLGLDRYRRADLRGSRDGPLLLAFCRESLRVAGRLERGGDVSFEPAAMRYRWGVDHPSEMARMRWFLRDGWGDLPHYASGDARTTAAEATLSVPCLRPRALAVELVLDAPHPSAAGVRMNGTLLGSRLVGPGETALVFDVPAEALFRGDNRLTLVLAEAVTLRRAGWRAR
ncbi:MAG: hypothetical protein ABW221_03985 [Vicinamibacteria bacterium]